MEITIATFNSLRDPWPKVKSVPLAILKDQFKVPSTIAKNEIETRLRTFSMTEYKKNARRGSDNVAFMTGAVFDFDNKQAATEYFKPIKEVVKGLEDKFVLFWWYTTKSTTPDVPRWRLVIPFAQKVPIEKWKDIYEAVLQYIGNPVGIDNASKKSAQMYFFPYLPANKEFESDFHNGNLLDTSKLPISNYFEKQQILRTKAPVNKNVSESIRKALDSINPDLSGEDWIRVGMALHSTLGDAGFTLWDHWSSTGSKYPDGRSAALLRRWKSFKAEGDITINTLFYIAKEHGFDPYTNLSVQNVKHLKSHLPRIEEYIEDTLDDDFLDWSEFSKVDIFDLTEFPFLNPIYETFKLNCPKFSSTLFLGATISLTGFLLTHHYKCDRSFNFYNMLLAVPGMGKDRIIELSEEILIHFSLDTYWIRDCATVQGFEKELERTKGIVFLIKDEVSDFFKSFRNKNINPHKQDLLKCFKQIYSGKRYQNPITKGSETKKYEKTYVSLLFIGNPSVFKHLCSDDFEEGLLSRFIIFHEKSENYGLRGTQGSQIQYNPIQILPIPPDLPHKRIIIPEECQNYIDKFLDCCLRKSAAMIGDEEKKYLLVRGAEAAAKLASLTVNERGEVSLKGTRWAVAIIVASMECTSFLMDKHFGNSPFLKDKTKVLDVIKALHFKRHSQKRYLTKRDVLMYSKVSLKNLDEIINYLLTTGEITIEEKNNLNKTTTQIIHYKSKR